MSKTTIKSNRLISVLLCSLFLPISSCVNKLDSETSPGTTPITFSTKINKTSTRVTNTTFEKGDKVGLYAMLSSTSIAEERYINNLQLECTGSSTLIPQKTVFYPVGDATLDFISYSPYLPTEISANSSIIPISIQSDQSNPIKRSQSDFLIATQSKVASSEKAVELKFYHKLVKFNITLTPKGDETVERLLSANPRIIATGFYNKADYNLTTGEFTNHKEETRYYSLRNMEYKKRETHRKRDYHYSSRHKIRYTIIRHGLERTTIHMPNAGINNDRKYTM